MTETLPVTTFAGPDELADCTAVVITYNSAGDVGGLLDSLPAAAAGTRLRVVVVDNDSTDDVAAVVSGYPGVVFVPAGGNLGYAGGINIGRGRQGRTRSIFVLNPDLRLAPGAIARLVAAVREPGVGAAVPRVLDEDGTVFPSQRREPTILRALGDTVLGRRWPGRPAWLSEMTWDPGAYEQPAAVDWATGAAVLVSAAADAAVGGWDEERFFLYSEETDYCRRLRDAGWTVRYVPDATATHRGGGSGTGPDLVALNEVNRVRYFRKYHGPLASAVFAGVVVVCEALRARRPGNRRALRALLSRRTRAALPRATRR